MKNISNLLGILAAMLTTVFISVAPVTAQELAPEHLAIARRYVDLTDQAKVYELALLETGIGVVRVLLPQNPEIEADLDKAINKTMQFYVKGKGELLNQFARVYAIRFSIEELEEIVAFYETPTGKKLALENVEANLDLRKVMNVFENNLRTEFIAKVRAELREAGFNF